VLELVLAHALDHPGALALRDDYQALTYGELYERVTAFASGLAASGVRPGDRAAVYLENSATFVVAALGCLWLGAAFVPLSVNDPIGRIARIVADCKPALVVVRDHDKAGSQLRTRTATVDTVLGRTGPTPTRALDAERDAYLIYTSGTTGVPKGVRVPERALRQSSVTTARLLSLEESTRALCVSSFHFDGSYGTVFPTLVAGGSLVIPKREDLLFLKRFYTAVREEGITHTSFSPSYLRLLVSSCLLGRLANSELQTLALGGEECVAEDVAELWAVLPDLRVFNRYGPTEATVAVTTYEIERRDVSGGKIPIGVPHDGVTFHVARPDGTLVDDHSEVGELYIGGEQLMRGYWGDGSLSRSVLRRDVVRGKVLYRTGDLVCRDAWGRYLYVGRADDVVKRNGVRISLGEVARSLRCVEGVTGALCLPVDLGGRLGIAAFVEAKPDVTVDELLDATSADLPAAMRPDEVFLLGSLPMTTSGKVDRQRLLDDAGRAGWQERPADGTAPPTAKDHRLVGLPLGKYDQSRTDGGDGLEGALAEHVFWELDTEGSLQGDHDANAGV
jgi:amino acid adenylation domain-containing protein